MVRAEVNSFNTLPKHLNGKTYIIAPLDSQKESAEFEAYSQNIKAHLSRFGLQQAISPEQSDFSVSFNYGVSGSHTVSGAVPLYGQTGGGTTFHSGTMSAYGSGGSAFGTYGGTSYTPPTYGVVGMMPYSYQNHTRFLNIRMVDLSRSTGGKVSPGWEVQVISAGAAGSFATVASCLFDAAFQNFNTSGSKRITLLFNECGSKK
jgi:hypothetical protein